MTRFVFCLVVLLALTVRPFAQDKTPFAQDAVPFSLQPGEGAPADGGSAAKGDLGGGSSEMTESAEDRRAQRLDMMFSRLAAAETKRRADRIARNILRRMSRSGSDTVDLLMVQAGAAMRAKRYGTALDLLDGVVRLDPEFPEGWNRRATVHFLRGDYSASLSDIEQVLRREPRHWGALAGLSMILVSMDRKSEAVVIMDKALAVHPFLEEMKRKREQLTKELDGAET